MCKDYGIKYKKINPDKIVVKKSKKLQPKKFKLEDIKKNLPMLYPHQKEIISILTNADCQERGQIIIPTGTGKTIIQIETIKNKYETSSKFTICIFVPSLYLIQDFYLALRAYLPLDIFIIINASQASTAIDDTSIVTHIDTISQETLKIHPKTIVLSTYQSSYKLIDQGLKFDIVFFDEAHHTVGEEEKYKAKLLNNDNFESKQRFFFTATPRVYVGKKECVSMDNFDQYGSVLYKLSLKEAIKLDIISDFMLVNCVYTPNNEEDEELQSINHIIACVIYAFTQYPIKKMIIYCNSLEYSKKIYDILIDRLSKMKKLRDIKPLYIDGSMNIYEKKQRIKYYQDHEFQNVRNVICSVNTISEGVDTIHADSILYAQSVQSSLLITQRIGRILRKKDMAYVFTPSSDNDFSQIEYTINALTTMGDISFTKDDSNPSSSSSTNTIISQLINSDGDIENPLKTDYNIEEINKIIDNLSSNEQSSGIIKTKYEIILELSRTIADENNIFTKKGIDKLIPELKIRCPTSFNGKTPHQSLARDLQVMRDKKMISFQPRGKTGEYKLLI